ncbi:MAG: UDP-N-acetylmuramoyl-L-alanyl-D-glutamate--2,6-diaminopimelate ligase [candidate division WOR-3 bacterium]
MYKDITHFVEEVEEGDIFVVLKGRSFDNSGYVKEAVKRGAKLIITPVDVDVNVEKVITENPRVVAEEWARRIYDIEGLELIGITGTNGKTTTSFILREILSKCLGPTALIGTVIWDDLTSIKPSQLTTPERFYIYRLLGRAKRTGGRYAVMEVSSIGLDQGRVDGLRFKVAVFTNLTRDHLDYHGTMENYLNAKLKLFKMLDENSFAVINADDPYSQHFINSTKARVITYGKTGEYSFEITEHNINGLTIKINGKTFYSPLIGEYNAYNITAAYSVAKILGASDNCTFDVLKDFRGVKGRLERVYSKDFHVFVDYAHTPDAMEKVLKELRPLAKKLIVVFGAGGNRDVGKRPLMGEVAERYGDIIVLTSDNPRFEEPEKIIEDIAEGIKHKKPFKIPDRREAIKFAINNAKKGDVVVILGKGHETYQEIKGIKHHFDDAEVVLEVVG